MHLNRPGSSRNQQSKPSINGQQIEQLEVRRLLSGFSGSSDVQHKFANESSITATAGPQIPPSNIQFTDMTPAVAQKSPFRSTVTFDDENNTLWTYSIVWTDGGTHTTDTGTVSTNAIPVAHLFTQTGAQSALISVTGVQNNYGTGEKIQAIFVNGDALPQIHPGADKTLNEGHPVLNKTDAYLADYKSRGPWRATVDWGDHTPLQTIPILSDNRLRLHHVYPDQANATYVARVYVSNRNRTSRNSFRVFTNNAAPIALNVIPVKNSFPTTLIPYDAHASFMDPGSADDDTFHVRIDYGDNSPVYTATTGRTQFAIGHQYKTAGQYAETITVTDAGGASVSSTQLVDVRTADGKEVFANQIISGFSFLPNENVAGG